MKVCIFRMVLMLCGFLTLSGAGFAQKKADVKEPAARSNALFKEEWEFTLRDFPEFASTLGERRYNDRWTDLSLAAIERRHQHDLDVLKKLAGIPSVSLSAADKLNYTLFRKQYEQSVEGFQFHGHLLALNHMNGIQTINDLGDQLRFANVKDYEDWLTRLRTFPAFMDQTIALLRQGMAEGLVHPRIIMERVPAQIEKQIVDDPAHSLFFKPFNEFPEAISAADRERLSAAAKKAVSENVVPSYRKLLTFFKNEYLPNCPEKVGAHMWPRGGEMYAFLARSFTTTKLTPEQIHEMGLREVKRIRAEMEKIITQTGFEGSFEEFLHFLRTDPQFYYKDPQELLNAYRALAKRIDPELIKLFGKLPRIPYGVEPIPDNIAPDTTTAYYRQPAADGSRAGTYFVNLYKPEVRPKYEMEALSIHEAVPGHHLQIALAMELGELPEFRRYGGFTVFVEGWGLYSESLGGEMGLYKDPYSKFGQLTYEMWRAVRLVVDTGMHRMDWTRQQAIDFFKANVAKTEQDIVNEIDRYIADPGQALAYKIGELKIKELRARAAKELGEKFDVRAFHAAVLSSGAIPIDVLEANINEWINRQKKSAASKK